MKRTILIGFHVLFSLITFGQKMKKVVVEDYDLFAKHEYHVLRKDKSVKHGHYKSSWVNGNPRQEGFYYLGKKDSLWTYFDPFKPLVSSRGFYEDGNKVGIWEYYDSKGKLINRYDHSMRFLSYTTIEDTIKTHLVRTADSTFETKLDRAPIYLEGEASKFRIIQENISYPEEAIADNVYGTVKISFFVDQDGHAHDHDIIKRIGGGCDEEALRVVKLIPDEWAPAMLNNTIIEARVIVLITFQLN